jgi:general secretion pathway protein G
VSGSARRAQRGGAPRYGFTLIELLVVFVIVGLLLSIAVPRYQMSVQRSKEAVLRQNLAVAREGIDRFYADRGRYPDSLDDLVREGYLRTLPNDPLTESSSSWVIVPPRDSSAAGRVYDIRTTAPGTARDGSRFEDW